MVEIEYIEKTHITKEGKKLLQAELDLIKKHKSELIIAKTNSEQKSIIFNQIVDLEHKLLTSEIYTPNENPETVRFGTKVKIYDVKNEREDIYRIVGPNETSILNDKYSIQMIPSHDDFDSAKQILTKDVFVSYNAPFVRQMFGKRVDDSFVFNQSGTIKEFEIVDINHYKRGLK